jgi:hypothetical protein
MLKSQFRSHLSHQLHRLNSLRCPAALEACCSLAGDLWRCGDTKGVRCILSACFRERNAPLLMQVLQAMEANRVARNSEVRFRVHRLPFSGGWLSGDRKLVHVAPLRGVATLTNPTSSVGAN